MTTTTSSKSNDSNDTSSGQPNSVIRRVAAASFIGNFVEWYDYASYGYLATIIAVVFFPDSATATGLMATFGVFAISFIVRPIGGVFWGHIGDRFGRKLALSISIVIMSISTFAIAFLPSYAMIGLWAPVMLFVVRLVQGFSASGEYAGAAIFIGEYASSRRRGSLISIVPASTAAGLLFGSLLVTLLTSTLDHESMVSWGWRVPFLLAAPLGLIGRYIRVRLEETPEFQQITESQTADRIPLLQTLRNNRRSVVIASGAACLNAVGFYTILSYMPTYLTTEVGLDESASFTATTVALAVYIGLIFLMGHLSDRLGRRTVLISASVLFIVLTVPLFYAFGFVGFVGVIAIQIVFGALMAMNDGTLASFIAELFPTSDRYSGFAFSFNMANAIFGGTAPFIATALITATGDPLMPGWYLIGAAVIALIAVLASSETAGIPLRKCGRSASATTEPPS